MGCDHGCPGPSLRGRAPRRLICAHSHIGGWGGGDRSGPIQPETRILDAINVKSSGFKRAQDIANALRLILDGAAEAYLMIE